MAVAGVTLVSDQALVAAELRLCRRDGRQTDGVNHRERRGPKIRDFQARCMAGTRRWAQPSLT